MIPKLSIALQFPDPAKANEDGILAYGGDLSPSRLMLAYRKGIFPWYSLNDPIIWWSPNPRFILELNEFKSHRSLKRRMAHFDVRFDTAFSEVISACSSIPRPGQRGTWIVPEMIEAYEALFDLGYAHSVEVYQNEVLVGGLYGVSVGRVFCGESMFSHVNDASKVALAVLVEHLKVWGYDFIDCQIPTDHLKRLGAKEISREVFLERLTKNTWEELQIPWIKIG